MSKTNGKNKIANPNEFYETPAWCTKAILNELHELQLNPNNVLDPCVGTGAIASVVRELYPKANIDIIDIEESLIREAIKKISLKEKDIVNNFENQIGLPMNNYFISNYLETSLKKDEYDLIVLNPPFSLAQEFVEKSIELSPNGSVVVLLRLNWLASKKRIAFHKKHPSDIFVLPKRPSFTNDGKTDGTEYAWFCFGPKFKGNQWKILDI